MRRNPTQQRRRRRRRVKNGRRKHTLILHREANNLHFFDGAVRRFLCGSNHEIADAASLQLGRAPHHGKRGGRNPCLKAGGAG